MRFKVLISIAALVLWPSKGALALSPVGLIPPVDAAVARPFDPPDGTYGPGHRGIDFASAPGTRVRAAAAGVVAYSGRVAGELAVSIAHGSGVVTTYSHLSEAWVRRGDRVSSGMWLGVVGSAHPGAEGLHFGVKVNGVYVDPAGLIAPLDLSGALRLTPLLWEPSSEIPPALATALGPRGPGSHERDCVAESDAAGLSAPPNDNVVIAVAGIGSKTEGADAADMYHPGPRFFGYPAERTYLFSYRSTRGPRLHSDYARTDTYGDLVEAAARLDELVRAVGRRHPGAEVDLIAHSQGGIVARTYLARRAAGAFEGGPRVENLVTIATPHTGAPVGLNVDHLRRETLVGPPLLDLATDRAAAGWPVPDPNSTAVAQLTPGSALLDGLAEQDVTFGTRTLTLGILNDLVVPADRTAMPGDLHRNVPPRGAIHMAKGLPLPGNGHSAVVTAPATRAYVHDFLRGRPEPCATGWDTWGRRAGRAVSWVEARLGRVVSFAEGLGGRLLRTLGSLRADGGQR